MTDIFSKLSINIKDTINEITLFTEINDNGNWIPFKTYQLKMCPNKYNSLLYYLCKSDIILPVFYNNTYWNIQDKIKLFFEDDPLPANSFYFKQLELNVFDLLSLSWTTLKDLYNYPWDNKIIITERDTYISEEVKLKYVFSYMYHIAKLIKTDVNEVNKENLDDVRILIF